MNGIAHYSYSLHGFTKNVENLNVECSKQPFLFAFIYVVFERKQISSRNQSSCLHKDICE